MGKYAFSYSRFPFKSMTFLKEKKTIVMENRSVLEVELRCGYKGWCEGDLWGSENYSVSWIVVVVVTRISTCVKINWLLHQKKKGNLIVPWFNKQT